MAIIREKHFKVISSPLERFSATVINAAAWETNQIIWYLVPARCLTTAFVPQLDCSTSSETF